MVRSRRHVNGKNESYGIAMFFRWQKKHRINHGSNMWWSTDEPYHWDDWLALQFFTRLWTKGRKQRGENRGEKIEEPGPPGQIFQDPNGSDGIWKALRMQYITAGLIIQGYINDAVSSKRRMIYRSGPMERPMIMTGAIRKQWPLS